MIKYIEEGAGSPSNEKNDCTVRALAIATNSSYVKAFAVLCQAGRKRNRGFYIEDLLKRNTTHLKCSFEKLPFRKPITVTKFINRYPEGTFYIRVRGHVFVIKDSTVYDLVEPRPMQRVTMAWRVTSLTKKKSSD